MMSDKTQSRTWRRKPNRLHRDVYEGDGVFAVTIGTRERRPVFTDAVVVARARGMLEGTARRTGFSLLVYCFMPDHLHLLVHGSQSTHLAKFIKAFKQASSFDYNRRAGCTLWQRSYYDHVLREAEDLPSAVAYILANPVRAELVKEMADYRFSGGELASELLVAT